MTPAELKIAELQQVQQFADRIAQLEADNARLRAALQRIRSLDPTRVSYHEGMTRVDWWQAMLKAAEG